MTSPCGRTAIYTALPAVVSFVFLLVVSWIVFGHALRPGLYAEVGLVFYVSLLLSCFQRRKARAAAFNVLVLLVFYGAYLIKFLALREGMAASDLASVGVLFFFLPLWQRLGLLMIAGALVVFLGSNLARPRALPAALLIAPGVAYFAGCILAPAAVLAVLERARPTSLIVELEPWRDGPLVTAARQLPRARTMEQFLAAPSRVAIDGFDAQRRARALATLPPPQRNLHMIVMEGFIDPLNFRGLRCPGDPIDPRLRRWMDEGQSMALAATFGGITARAEFEVLCGVPSYERLGVDFMAMRGGAVPCLPSLLRRRGYVTFGTNSSPPTFFNREVAYPAVGFERSRHGPDFLRKPEDMDGEILSDAAFYRQVLPSVVPLVEDGRRVFNYVLTLVGHYPFELNPERHPRYCESGTEAAKVADAAHYDSIAVADYVESLEAHDPESVVVVLADHLPSLGFGHAGYREAEYRLGLGGLGRAPFWVAEEPSWLTSRATMLVVRKARSPVSLGLIPHYLIPEAVLDLLTDGAYCRATACFRTMPIVNRPLAGRPVYTTPSRFPEEICTDMRAADDPPCGAAAEMNRALEAEYDALLRAAASGVTVAGMPESR